MHCILRKRWVVRTLLAVVAAGLVVVGGFFFVFRPFSPGNPPEIPVGWGYNRAAQFVGEPASPKPLEEMLPPRNPYLAPGNSSNMHVDSYASDVHPLGGPLGINPAATTYAHGAVGGECPCVTFDSRRNILAVCATFREFSLMLLAPDELRPLAKLALPPRASTRTLNLRKIMTDTSGGAYFFLDNQDRVVLVDADQRLKVIEQLWDGDDVEFEVVQDYDLLPLLREYTDENDVITSVLPDWSGRYWFVSRGGLVGVLAPATGAISALCLENEEIQNSFAVDRHGVYIVSDRALYGIALSQADGRPSVVWREEYERSSRDKPGTITRGSGTTPTLLGTDYVAIADNAEPQINVLVYKRGMDEEGERLVCRVPVFEAGKSATENTLIGIGNSLIVENNYGYDLFLTMMFGRTGAGGVARVDFDEGTGTGHVVWTNPIISQTTVPKLSLENGLVYVYAKDPAIGWAVDAYYLAALDFETGETVFQVLAGTGVSYDNNWAPITLGPDGSAYVGVLRGLVRIHDQPDTE